MLNFYLHTLSGRLIGIAILLVLVFEFFRTVLKAKVKWEPRDMWIGLYRDPQRQDVMYVQRIITIRYYLCIIPCFPIIWETKKVKKYDMSCKRSKEMKEGALCRQYNGLRSINPHLRGSKKWQDWDYGWFETNEAIDYQNELRHDTTG